MTASALIAPAYLVASVLFIYGLKQLQRVSTARRGNALASLAMLLAIVVTLLVMGAIDVPMLIAALVVGSAIVRKIEANPGAEAAAVGQLVAQLKAALG